MPKKESHILVQAAGYAPLWLLLGGLKLIGYWGCKFIAPFIAGCAYLLDMPHQRLARRQIVCCIGKMGFFKREKIVFGAFYSATMMAVETIFSRKAITEENFRQHIHMPNEAKWRKYIDAGTGAIMATGHFGNWEIGELLMSRMGYGGVVVAKLSRNRFLNKHLDKTRYCPGFKMVSKSGAIPESIKAIRAGKLILIAADMYAGRGGLRVNYFGYPASTHRSLAILAVKYKVPLLVGYMRREKGYLQFTMDMPVVITPDMWQDKEDPILWITQQYNDAIASFAKQCPQQYFGWLHRRWRGDNRPWIIDEKRKSESIENTDS